MNAAIANPIGSRTLGGDRSTDTSASLLLLLSLLARVQYLVPDSGVSVLRVHNARASELHHDTLAAIQAANAASGQSERDVDLLVSSEEEAVVQEQRLLVRNIVTRKCAIAASPEHSIPAFFERDLD